ncbi:tRNA wybutosine-synthesizing protein 4-like isoform X6 [Tachypleus tridentatus]|uniref:tRNA wybutosine-synthesizing protein 4-like isoform X6 n=1 Tax=Tachypleus tridentatus TaxID=6853 RepID=UPI003FD43D6E
MLKMKSQLPVQGTNDSSIISKFSMALKGYFSDEFLKFFAANHRHRSPLINRGYYIRAKAMERMFHQFLQTLFGFPVKQIISLGAGFDTSYFRLKSEKFLCDSTFIEVDFESVITRKLKCVNSHSVLKAMMPEGAPKCSNKSVIFQGRNYILIGADLRVIYELDKALEDAGISFECPTLIFSECAMTYIDVESSNRLIEWASKKFPNAAFVTYEQIHPDDGFGLIMFGQQCVLLPNGLVLTFGGFGIQDGKHQRLGGCLLTDVTTETFQSQKLEVEDQGHCMGQRIHHCTVLLKDQRLVVIGGRSSPSKAYNEIVTLRIKSTTLIHSSELKSDTKTQTSGDIVSAEAHVLTHQYSSTDSECPPARWRHTACVVQLGDVEKIVVFGGRAPGHKVLASCFILETEKWTWEKVPQDQPGAPGPRHSHSCTVWKSVVVISGGVDLKEKPLAAVHTLDLNTLKWKQLFIPSFIPRYSHTSHIWKNNLILVGGVNTFPTASPGVGVVNLQTCQYWEWHLPPQDLLRPILLHNHSSVLQEERRKILIFGGGGNCFSFGTHLNTCVIEIDLQELCG